MNNYINFDTPIDNGIIGSAFYSNGYGASVTKVLSNDPITYNLGFLKQQDYHTWSCEIDTKLETISLESEVYNLTEEELDEYLTQIKTL